MSEPFGSPEDKKVQRRTALALEIATEVERAMRLWAPMHSPHEGIAVIREEYQELEREVFKKQTEHDYAAMRKEAVQIAAMGMRFILDLIDRHPVFTCGCTLDTNPPTETCALHVGAARIEDPR